MEKKEALEEEYIHQVDSASTSSTVSSNFGGSDDAAATNCSSGDISTTPSSSSGEITAAVVAEAAIPKLLAEAPASVDATTVAAARLKCVGRNNKGVTWGFTSVIGRWREMEDAVAVVPGFMSCTCDRVGGCTAPGSRSSGGISPVSLFGVYDGHGGCQVAKFCARRMHEVVAEDWNRETFDGLEWQRRWEAAFSSSFERADNEAQTDAQSPEMVGSTAVVMVLSGC